MSVNKIVKIYIMDLYYLKTENLFPFKKQLFLNHKKH